MKTTTALSISLSTVLSLSVLIAPANATVYKWVDSAGHLNYTERPAPPGIKYEIVEDKIRLAAGLDDKKDSHTSYLEETTQADNEEDSTEKKQRQIADKQKKIQDNYREQLEKYCESQQNNVKLLSTDSPIAWEENGKTELLSSKEKKEKLQEIKDSIKKNCSNASNGNSEANKD